LRKFALLVSACTLFLFTPFAAAQQVDLMVGGSTLMSASTRSDLVNFQPPVETNGTYIGISGDYVGFRKRRYGINVETAWRYKKANYPFNSETYRPIFTDVNALFQPRITKKVGLDFLGGIGVATTRFNLPGANSCGAPGGGCVNYTSSNHFMEDVGFGVRYRFWRSFFARPEAHYYHIQNNIEFRSDNVFRVGASIGYAFGSK